jgi:hypothetical protein
MERAQDCLAVLHHGHSRAVRLQRVQIVGSYITILVAVGLLLLSAGMESQQFTQQPVPRRHHWHSFSTDILRANSALAGVLFLCYTACAAFTTYLVLLRSRLTFRLTLTVLLLLGGSVLCVALWVVMCTGGVTVLLFAAGVLALVRHLHSFSSSFILTDCLH